MANKKVYLKTVNEDPFVGGQTETQYINNGESDFAIVYDEHDHSFNNSNIAGKVLFIKNAKTQTVISSNQSASNAYGSNGKYYSLSSDVNAINLNNKIGNVFTGSNKVQWMKNKLPAGVQAKYESYFKDSSTVQPAGTNTANNAIAYLNANNFIL